MSDELRALLGLLSEPQRMAVVGALVLDGPAALPPLAERAGLSLPAAQKALTRLQGGGLVSDDGGVWSVHLEVLREAVRRATPEPGADPGADAPPAAAAVLRAFVRDGRLTSVPTQRSKRLVVLDHVARVFEVGVRYPEREVNTLLRSFHADYAALRRYLVDEHFLARDHGEYWRSGGSVEV